jgi:tetratricopeptide (TPR) repeat protein
MRYRDSLRCHPGPAELQALASAADPARVSAVLLQHLAICAECRSAIAAIDAGAPVLCIFADTGTARQESLTHGELDSLIAFQDRMAASLRSIPRERWPLELANRNTGDARVTIASLLHEAELLRPRSLAASEALTDAAILKLRLTPAEPELWSRAYTQRANYLRIAGRFDEALRSLSEATASLSGEESVASHLIAEIFEVLGAVRREQGRHPDALLALTTAIELYRRSAASQRYLNRALFSMALVHFEQGEWLLAVDQWQRLIPHVSVEDEPVLYVMLLNNTAFAQALANNPGKARTLLPEIVHRVEALASESLKARCIWLEAVICSAEGNWPSGASLYRSALKKFMAQRMAFDAALVGLELAALYLRHDLPTEAARVALDILPLFETLDVERESLANALLLVEAVRRQLASETRVREAIGQLRRAGRRAVD